MKIKSLKPKKMAPAMNPKKARRAAGVKLPKMTSMKPIKAKKAKAY